MATEADIGNLNAQLDSCRRVMRRVDMEIENLKRGLDTCSADLVAEKDKGRANGGGKRRRKSKKRKSKKKKTRRRRKTRR